MITILAIDPGDDSGFALYKDSWLADSGRLDIRDYFTVRDKLLEVSPSLVVIEDYYLSEKRTNIKTYLWYWHLWSVGAQTLGIHFEKVIPNKWEGYQESRHPECFEKRGKKKLTQWERQYPKKQGGDKKAFIKIAEKITGKTCLPDEADAILIGDYWVHKGIK